MFIKLYKEFSKVPNYVTEIREGKVEYLKDLYLQYYYIVDKYCQRYPDNKKDKVREIAESVLKEAIIKFCLYDANEIRYSLSHYIYNKFQSFDYRVKKEMESTTEKSKKFSK